jgi:2-(1,2-epoxy-1,2-dihydrophenyl)acetyl-CoA isomerase
VPFESIDGIEVTLQDHLLRIRLNRPDHHNAMTPDHMNHVSKLCAQAEEDDDVRVVLLTGTGDSFCAGADLSGVDLSASGGQIPPVSMSRNLFLALLELSKPLVGAINGVAAGGGLGLALCCDIRLGSDDARFATSFSRIGLTANDAVAWLLPRIVGIAKAIELIAIARPIDAAEAERIGLISYRYANDEFEARVGEFVAALVAAPPVGLRFSKRLVMDGLNRSYRDHVLAQEYATLANRTIANHDIEEGVAAFQEKRPPNFRGKLMRPVWENY